MSFEVTDIGEADTEALQAQIDLSLSFAQDLVSSWVKPSVKLALSRGNDTEQELEEYMRRPPRLGVGAPIPESAGLSRDSARLKTRLISKRGNKRAREYDDDVEKSPSDNEEESKGGAIRKKAKVDPFGGMHGKKQKPTASEATGLSTLHSTLVSVQETTPKKMTVEIDSMDIDDGPGEKSPLQEDVSISSPSPSPTRKKKKRRRKKHTECHTLPTPQPSVENVEEHRHGGSIPHSAVMKMVECSPATSTSAPAKSALAELRTPERVDISLMSTPKSLPHPRLQKLQTSPVLKFPILNLNGPPPEIDVDDNKTNSRNESPKKKRKRRKKRKSSMANLPTNGDP